MEDRPTWEAVGAEQKRNLRSLRSWRKFFFAVGYLGHGLVASITAFFQQAFLLEVAQVPAAWVGNIVLAKQFWDAAVDPFIGAASDGLESRWGRRRPFCVVAVVPLVLLWVLQWCAPGWVADNEAAKISYFMTVILLFSFFSSMFYVPYQAVIPDLATTYHSRTSLLLGVRVFSLLGSGTGSYLWGHLIELFPTEDSEGVVLEGMPADYRLGYIAAALIATIPIFTTALIGIFSIKELPPTKDLEMRYKSRMQKMRLAVRSFTSAVGSLAIFPPFVVLLLLHVLAAIGIALFTGNLVLYFKYVLLKESSTSMALLVLQGSLTVTLFFWFAVCSKVGLKVISYFCGVVILTVGFTMMYFFTPDTDIAVVYMNMALLGFGASATSLMTNAMVPDVLEMYQKDKQKRHEALFYGIFAFLDTLAQGLAAIVAGYSLQYAGYLSPYQQAQTNHVLDQPDGALTVMTWNVSLCPLIITSLCFPLTLLYFLLVELRYKKMKLAHDGAFVATWSDDSSDMEHHYLDPGDTGSLTSGSELTFS